VHRITTEIEVSMAHRLMKHEGECQKLHGHNYKIRVAVDSYTGPSVITGMVMDFANLKQILKSTIHDKMDHRIILHENDPIVHHLITTFNAVQIEPPWMLLVPFHPTAEEMALYIVNTLRKEHPKTFECCFLTCQVFETEKNSSTYMEDRDEST